MVRMKNKVMRFPQPRRGATEVPSDDPMILFSLGDRRFAIQWIVTEGKCKTGGSDRDAEAAPEEEEAGWTLDLNDQLLPPKGVLLTALDRFLSGPERTAHLAMR